MGGPSGPMLCAQVAMKSRQKRAHNRNEKGPPKRALSFELESGFDRRTQYCPMKSRLPISTPLLRRIA
ncbi:DUF6053 domain-containing protein [Lysobacter yananisis]|uniref:DUF6053 domain-containing protein n=1 Tax=Lysobacter yananisis TaxID=1003114 RepID=UPI003CE54B2A